MGSVTVGQLARMAARAGAETVQEVRIIVEHALPGFRAEVVERTVGSVVQVMGETHGVEVSRA